MRVKSPVGSVAPPDHVLSPVLQFKFRVLTRMVHTEIAKMNDYSSRDDASSGTASSDAEPSGFSPRPTNS